MTVAELMAALAHLPADMVVLMDCDGGLAGIAGLDPMPGAPAPGEVVLLPSLEE